jgi:hypothetical protein
MYINKEAELRRVIARDNAAEFKVISGAEAEWVLQTINITPRELPFRIPSFLRPIPFNHFLSYMMSSTWRRLSLSLASVKLGLGGLPTRGGRWKQRVI